MFVLTAVQVDLSLGSMPSLVQTPFVNSAACSSVKAFGILEILVNHSYLNPIIELSIHEVLTLTSHC